MPTICPDNFRHDFTLLKCGYFHKYTLQSKIWNSKGYLCIFLDQPAVRQQLEQKVRKMDRGSFPRFRYHRLAARSADGLYDKSPNYVLHV